MKSERVGTISEMRGDNDEPDISDDGANFNKKVAHVEVVSKKSPMKNKAEHKKQKRSDGKSVVLLGSGFVNEDIMNVYKGDNAFYQKYEEGFEMFENLGPIDQSHFRQGKLPLI